MKKKRTWHKKTLFIFCSVVIIMPLLIIIFISPIAKSLVEKYSVKYTGRQIRMSSAYVNPFTGFVRFNNVKIYEANNDSIFISSGSISADFALMKLFHKTYELTSLTLDKPRGSIVLSTRYHLNFDDLITRFSSTNHDTTSPPLHLNILNIKIKDGVFYFHSTLNNVNYFIKNVNIESAGKRWDLDTLDSEFSFSSGPSTGEMHGNFTVNFNNLNYRYHLVAQKYDMDIIEQYLKDLVNYGTFSANLDADLRATGNLKDEEVVDTKGRIAVNDFHFGKNKKEDYLSFTRFVLRIDEVNPKKHIYHLDSVALTHPYFKYENYDHLDNLETMFGKNGANVTAVSNDKERYNLIIELGNYIMDVSKNFFHSQYRINKVSLTQGDLQYADYAPSEQFFISANPLNIRTDSVNQSKGRIQIYLNTGLKPYGKATVYASINPRDSADFDVKFNFDEISLAQFNPYIISYTSFPFDRGTLNFDGDWNVRDGNIHSENHLLIIDPHVAKRQKNKAYKWVPMRLALALMRSSGYVMDYQIPVTGTLKESKVHIGDIVWGVVKNIFIKPITTPYRLTIKEQENTIYKSLNVKWPTRESAITGSQQKFINKLVYFLEKNPTESVVITPQQYEDKEKEYILFFEAKKKYFLAINNRKTAELSEDDSEYVDGMSVKDTLFVTYLNKRLRNSLIFTIQGKCGNLIPQEIVDAKFNKLNQARKANFLSSFKEKGIDSRVVFSPAQNDIPYNGFSYFKITYKGDFPDYLIKAYKRMEELNSRFPRDKYKKERDEEDLKSY